MLISNQKVHMQTENGQSIQLIDRLRGTRWLLDQQSIFWSKNDSPDAASLDRLHQLQPISAKADHNSITVIYAADGTQIKFVYTLCSDYLEVRLLTPSDGQIEGVSFPGSFNPIDETKKIVLPIMQGMLWDGRGSDFDHFYRSGSHTGFSMQMAGIIAKTGAMLIVPETSADSLWWCKKNGQDFSVQNMQISSLGTMRYERVARLYLTDTGIVPLAKAYRYHVKSQGRFLSWQEKLKTRPELDKLFGSLMCFIGYSHDPDINYIEEFRKLKNYGFEHILAYPVMFNTFSNDFQMGRLPPIHMSNAEIDQLKLMGIDVCPWTWINEARDDGTEKRRSKYKINRDGKKLFSWQIDAFKWYRICSPEMAEFEKLSIKNSCKQMTWDHFDVLTCAQIGECYALNHKEHLGKPMSRSEDLQWLRKTLLIGQGEGDCRRIVSSENFNDLFSCEYDIGSVKAWPQYGPWIFWPVPLTSLVYHDSILHSWWEPHNYNSPYFNRAVGPDLYEYGGGRPDLQSTLDALMGCPPDVFPFGAQYGWTGRDKETFTYKFKLEDPLVQYSLEKAKPVAKLHKRIGKLEMIDFKILSDDGWIQRSVFADGTEILANFSSSMRNDIDGIEPIPGQSWILK